jgi:hypothetical protein
VAEDPLLAEHGASVDDKVTQQRELLGRQRYWCEPLRHLVRVFVEFDIGEVQPPSTELVDVPAGATTQDDTKAGYYLFEAEWFGEVVVGTEG